MRNLELEVETIQISIFSEIVLQILHKHKELSVNKLLVFAYLVKKERLSLDKVYKGNSKQDLVCKCVSLLAGDYEEYCNSIEYIIKAIHLLITKNVLQIDGNILSCKNKDKLEKSIFSENIFIEKSIEASKKMTDRQFLKEVMYNV